MTYLRRRQPLTLPTAGIELSSRTNMIVVEATALLPTIGIWSSADLLSNWIPDENDESWRLIRHDLSFAMNCPPPVPSDTWADHTAAEASIQPNAESAWTSQSDADDFIRALIRVNAGVTSGLSAPRTGHAFTKGLDGSHVLFPTAECIDQKLRELWAWLDRSTLPVLCRATVAYCCISNLHPFTDGNGRTARWLWASLLRKEGLCTAPFFPLYEFFVRSRGSSVICLRLAELRGSWDPLVDFLARTIISMSKQQALIPDRTA